MSGRNKVLLVLAVLAAVTGGAAWLRTRKAAVRDTLGAQAQAREAEERAEATNMYSRTYRKRYRSPTKNYEATLVGELAATRAWTDELRLTPAQRAALTDLDGLTRDALDHYGVTVADYMDTNPADYRQYLDRVEARFDATHAAARRVAALGLLTEAQAGYVLQWRVSKSGGGRRPRPAGRGPRTGSGGPRTRRWPC